MSAHVAKLYFAVILNPRNAKYLPMQPDPAKKRSWISVIQLRKAASARSKLLPINIDERGNPLYSSFLPPSLSHRLNSSERRSFSQFKPAELEKRRFQFPFQELVKFHEKMKCCHEFLFQSLGVKVIILQTISDNYLYLVWKTHHLNCIKRNLAVNFIFLYILSYAWGFFFFFPSIKFTVMNPTEICQMSERYFISIKCCCINSDLGLSFDTMYVNN